jgi:hypothetical protein
MEKKWLDLIADPSIPDPTNSKTSIRGWYSKACLAYEKWRFLQIIKYTDEADAPPLFPVDFNLAVAWMEKMKKVSKKPQSLGIVNEESRQISTQMEALVNNANSANQDRTFGNATNISSLTTAAPAAVTAGAPLFLVPPPQEIRLTLSGKRDSELSDLLSRSSKKKAKKQLSENELAELAAKKLLDDSRRERASEKMKDLRLSADPVHVKKKRCTICNKYWKDFKLNGVVPHQHLSNSFKFCPLADDHEMLKQHLITKQQEKQQYDKERYNSNPK